MMDDNPTSRRLRVLIFTNKENASAIPLQKILLQRDCPVRMSYNVEEFIDILKKPYADYGMVIVLNPVNEKIFKNLVPEKALLLEFGPGRCRVAELLEKVDCAAKTLGRY